jgi:hypothetical protein
MTQDRKKDFIITVVMFVAMAIAITVGFIVPRLNGRGLDPAQNEQRMFDMVDAAAAVSAEKADAGIPIVDRTDPDPEESMIVAEASGEVKGAPLNPPAEESAEVRGAPLGESGASPEDPDEVDTSGMTPLRTIPQESWDMLEKLDNKSANPEELYNFTKTKDGKFLKVSFGALGSYDYEIPDPDELREAEDQKAVLGDQIPEPLKKIDGEEVVIVGFMVPIEVTREGQVKSFALTQNQNFCCFGVPPGMNEWIMVKMEEGETAEFTLDLPVAAFGKIAVGEEIEDGYIMSVYRMSAGEVIDAQELIRRTQQG